MAKEGMPKLRCGNCMGTDGEDGITVNPVTGQCTGCDILTANFLPNARPRPLLSELPKKDRPISSRSVINT